MNSVPLTSPARAQAPEPEPLYLGSVERPWFAWLHRAAPSKRDGVGLLIVPPFGFEAVASYRSMRRLALQASAAGLDAVRIDLDGTGDSAGDDLDEDRLGKWQASVAAGADLLRSIGATRLVLVGIRLGALVAAEVAAHRSDVAGMVAIAPVVSGRKWIRESRALHQSLDLSVPPPGVPFTPPEGLLEVAGYVLTAETRAALERTNLEEAERAPAPAVLVLDRDDMAPSTAWIERLQALGCSVDARRLPGYVEMVVDPHKSRIPAALLEATIEFAQSRPVLPAKTVVPMARTTPTALFGDVVEEPMVTRAGVRGIVSRPAQGRAARRALVLLNAGGVRRIGPNRLYTTLARRFAREDMLVLRIDLSGIGDTPARPDMPENLSYHEHALDDIASVLEWVRAQGVEDAHLCGMCSGGYYAFQAALADRAWAGLVAVNPGDPAGQDSPYEAANYAAHTMRRIPQLDAWLKLIRGNVNVSKAMRMLSRRARSLLQSRVIDLARSLGLRVEGDVGADLLTIASRDVKTTFVFCDREPGLPLFRERGGSAVRRLTRGGKVSVRIVVGPDHTYTPYWSHDVLIDEIRVAVTRRSR